MGEKKEIEKAKESVPDRSTKLPKRLLVRLYTRMRVHRATIERSLLVPCRTTSEPRKNTRFRIVSAFADYATDRYEKSQNSTVMLEYHLTHTNSRRELFDDKETKHQKKKKKNEEKYSEITMSTEEKQMTVRLSRPKNPFRSSSCLSSDSLMVS
uniref:Uncharacterized protein n=1 Tax=Vespula pensylvanica TaxID=30213 RepID=A0A834P2L5_VESPE|nr:hypothetical protein H0235_008096 [Vespula pensylvanica]